jgi:hydrogenase expression/formation protein HypE
MNKCDNQRISLAHGSGGKLAHDLIKNRFLTEFKNPILSALADSAVIDLAGTKLAFTTDSHVVRPLFYPGGDIGKLAIYGTVNDLAVVGAKPLYISCSYLIEEGFDGESLDKITRSIGEAARSAGVLVVTGDTKVVEHGKGDGIFINTAGIGVCNYQLPQAIKIGDKVIINGPIGDHEIAIISARGELGLNLKVESDCAPLADLISHVLTASRRIKFMRDPTRGGLATILNEIVEGRDFGILIEEKAIPIREEIKGACSLLGFDPLYLANEGKVAIIVGYEDASRVIDVMRAHPLGREAQIIGEIVKSPKGRVCLKTEIGGTRIVDMPIGTQLPRIC